MSMHYSDAQGHYGGFSSVSSRDSSDHSVPHMQSYRFYDTQARHEPDACRNGSLMHGRGATAPNGHADMSVMNFPCVSPSPPHSSISSDMLSQSTCFDYNCDSDSHGSAQTQIYSELPSELDHARLCDSVRDDSSLTRVANNVSSDGVTHMLKELESVLLGSDDEEEDSRDYTHNDGSSWTELLDEVQSAVLPANDQPADAPADDKPTSCSASLNSSRSTPVPDRASKVWTNHGNNVRDLLITCAAAIDEKRLDIATTLIEELRKEVSVFGDPLQRLAAYMSEALVAKLQSSGFSIYRFLKCSEAPAPVVLSAMQKLYEICPYIKFGYMAANGAIAEAFKDEARVHIFDFQIAQGTQWFSLIQGLANRPGGPPSIRLTTVEEKGAQGSPIGGMDLVENRLRTLAESLNVPFEFKCIHSRLCELQADMIELREGEALAVNFTLQLHHLPDESVCVGNPRDRMIRMMRSLNPKVFTMVEQEANTNTAPFFARFVETLDFYSAMFESIDVALPRESKDRVNVEEQCLARDIVNVVACEGLERLERHELMGKWRARMGMAGFRPRALSAYVNSIIRVLLESYHSNYMLKEEGDALFLGWTNRALIVASAWQ